MFEQRLFPLNPYLPSGLVHLYKLGEFICHLRGMWCMCLIFILFNGTIWAYGLKLVQAMVKTGIGFPV